METLVTGATGFAGAALTAALIADGHTVRALVRPTSKAESKSKLSALGATLIEGELSNEPSLEAAAKGAEVVFHCAKLDDPKAPRERLEAVNLVGTENLLAACRRAGVKRVVYLSTADVTQGTEARSYVDEDYAQPANFLDARTETRALAEDLVVAASDEVMQTVTLRIGWLWGEGDTCLAPRLAQSANDKTFRWIDDGRALVATTNIANLVAGMRLAATVSDAEAKVFYLTDDERITAREFLTRLAGAIGVTLPRASTPFALAYGLAWISERASAAPAHLRSEVVSHGRSAHFNVQRARKELGYAPAVTVSEGLERVRASVKKG